MTHLSRSQRSLATTTAPAPGALVGSTRLHTLGLITFVAGILGATSAIVILAWPAQVSDQRYSYPFDATAFTAVQSWFAVQHLGLLAGLYGLAWLAWSGSSRPTRAGLVLALVGMVGLTVCELFAITAAPLLVGSSRANAVDSSYGAPMIAIGAGLVIAGIGLARRPVLGGAGRWLPVAVGAYVFVPMFPAVFGSLVLGRIAIGGWMLLFAALGASLARAERDGDPHR
ncbi:MAG TPA: hypothetical protein VFL69_00430 [Marmoricola sp.]|nr:hypothetical protein [Marmoricola sp.]